MKKSIIIKMILTTTLIISINNLFAQSSITPAREGQKGRFDAFLEIDGVRGESGKDSLVRKRTNGYASLSAGAVLSQVSDNEFFGSNNKSLAGFTGGIHYNLAFSKLKLQVGTQFQQGGVRVASGDLNGDGKAEESDLRLNYLTIPIKAGALVYLNRNRQKGLFLNTGLYGSYLLSAKAENRIANPDLFKKWDAGFLLSIEIAILKPVSIEGGYQKGLLSIYEVNGRKAARNGIAFLTLNVNLNGSASGKHLKRATLYARKQVSD